MDEWCRNGVISWAFHQESTYKTGVVAPSVYKPSNGEVEAGRFWIRGQVDMYVFFSFSDKYFLVYNSKKDTMFK